MSTSLVVLLFAAFVCVAVAGPLHNDRCSNAEDIGSFLDGTEKHISWTTVGATEDLDASCEGRSLKGPGVWYKFTADHPGIVTVDTCRMSTFDNAIAILSGSCSALHCIAQENRAESDYHIKRQKNRKCADGLGSEVSFLINGGHSARIFVHSQWPLDARNHYTDENLHEEHLSKGHPYTGNFELRIKFRPYGGNCDRVIELPEGGSIVGNSCHLANRNVPFDSQIETYLPCYGTRKDTWSGMDMWYHYKFPGDKHKWVTFDTCNSLTDYDLTLEAFTLHHDNNYEGRDAALCENQHDYPGTRDVSGDVESLSVDMDSFNSVVHVDLSSAEIDQRAADEKLPPYSPALPPSRANNWFDNDKTVCDFLRVGDDFTTSRSGYCFNCLDAAEGAFDSPSYGRYMKCAWKHRNVFKSRDVGATVAFLMGPGDETWLVVRPRLNSYGKRGDGGGSSCGPYQLDINVHKNQFFQVGVPDSTPSGP
jgi:hypothetical protein